MTITRKALQVFARTFAKAIEYGLFAALVGAVIVGSVATLGKQTNSGFSTMSTAMTENGISATQ
jgi:pilus assembly protein Flp/PilA